jgi:hypothetical protein
VLKKYVKAGVSVMDALKAVAHVKTAYGGKFVVSINNISSDPVKKVAWFYYINGILANVGSTDYTIHPGDVVRWDFHYWGDGMSISAEIQDFPHMLTGGYGGKTYPTIIAYEPEFRALAEKVREKIKNEGANCTLAPVNTLTENEKMKDNLILLGRNSSLLRELFENYRALGLKYRMVGDSVMDWKGTEKMGDFAEAIQSPYNPEGAGACENTVIIISGTGSLEDAVDAIFEGTHTFWYMSGES